MHHDSEKTNTLPDPKWAWDILWVGLLAIYAFAGYATTPFHGDESMQVFMSKDFAYQFINDNVDEIRYDPEGGVTDVEQGLRLLNGSVNKYSIGLAWYLAGYTEEDINWPWLWDQTVEFNMENGFYPGDDLLLVSRVPSALFLALSVVALYGVGMALAGRPLAYIATLYYALNPAVLLNGRRAMMEGSMLLGGLLTVLAGIWLLQQRGRRAWLAAFLLALATGFAVASKHTNAFVALGVFGACAAYAIYQTVRGDHQLFSRFAQLFLAGVLAFGLFYALNPVWWGNPLQRAAVVLDWRTGLLGGQIEEFGGYDSITGQVAGFYRQVFVGRPMYAESDDFDELMRGQSASYEASPFSGIYPPGVSVALFAIFALGLGVLFTGRLQMDEAARWVVGGWALVTLFLALFLTPLEWQRYYLPLMPVIGLIAPLGIAWLFRLYTGDARQNSPEYRRGSARVRTGAAD